MSYVNWRISVARGCQRECCWHKRNYCSCLAETNGCRVPGAHDYRKVSIVPEALKLLLSPSVKDGDVVWLNSAGEMFGSWYSDSDIHMQINMCRTRPNVWIWMQTTYPDRMFSFDYPPNIILAVKIDQWNKENRKRASILTKYSKRRKNTLALALTPLLEDIDYNIIKHVDQVVVSESYSTWTPKVDILQIKTIVRKCEQYNVPLFLDPPLTRYTHKYSKLGVKQHEQYRETS